MNRKLNVLVACEYSGIVRDSFIKLGHNAISCDLLDTERPGPHYKGDVLDIINDGFDLMIAHPPCTYMSRAGARWMYPSAGFVCEHRLKQGAEAKEFFMKLYAADCEHIAIENPLPLKIVGLPSPTQIIQPYEYGDPYSKKTLLWLKGLPKLTPTKVLTEYVPFLPSNTGGAKRGQKHTCGISHDAKTSSRTFPGIAQAMAEQWSNFILSENETP